MASRGPRVHLELLAGAAPSVAPEVRRRLSLAGVEFPSGHDRSAWAARVLLAGELSDDTVHAVRKAARDGASRVLVVATAAADHGPGVWRVLAAGAADVLSWDSSCPDLVADGIAARVKRWCEVDACVESVAVRGRLVGRSPAWVAALRHLVEVAWVSEVSVLIVGESGTGKELAARLIHDLDPKRDKRELVTLDCTTIVPTLSGSEFFGHERGAFTDAITTREGAFGEANGGTLFLDELGELPLGLQAELLRVVQEGMYKRLGSGVWRRTRFRLVCATNRDLREEVARGRFRADLFHRVAAWTVRLPALRERPGDIAHLAGHFLRELRPDAGEPAMTPSVLDVLERREYPGNVRELRQLIARTAGRHVGPGPITVGDLPPEEWLVTDDGQSGDCGGYLERWARLAVARNLSLRDIRKAAEDAAIAVALADAEGKVRRAARRLHVTPRALQMRRAAARKVVNE